MERRGWLTAAPKSEASSTTRSASPAATRAGRHDAPASAPPCSRTGTCAAQEPSLRLSRLGWPGVRRRRCAAQRQPTSPFHTAALAGVAPSCFASPSDLVSGRAAFRPSARNRGNPELGRRRGAHSTRRGLRSPVAPAVAAWTRRHPSSGSGAQIRAPGASFSSPSSRTSWHPSSCVRSPPPQPHVQHLPERRRQPQRGQRFPRRGTSLTASARCGRPTGLRGGGPSRSSRPGPRARSGSR